MAYKHPSRLVDNEMQPTLRRLHSTSYTFMNDIRPIVAAGAWACFGLVFVVLTCGIVAYPKSVASDSAQGLLAAHQYELKRSPTFLTCVWADPQDLSNDALHPIGMWAPGYQAAPLLFHRFGVSWGSSLKLTVLTCVVVGLLGWGMYFSLFKLPRWALPTLLLGIVSFSYTTWNAAEYSGGDLLLWAFAPVLILVNLRALRRANECSSQPVLALIGGVGATSIFLLKYSGIFVGVGIGAAWIWSFARRRSTLATLLSWSMGAMLGMLLVGLAGVPAGPTQASSIGIVWKPVRGLLALVVWPTAMTDMSAVVVRLCRCVGLSAADAKNWINPFVGLLLIVLLLWMAFHRKEDLRWAATWYSENRTLATLVAWVVVADTVLFSAMVFAGGAVEIAARIARVSGCMMLPVVTMLFIQCVRSYERISRALAIGVAFTLFTTPAVWGVRHLVSLVLHIKDEQALCEASMIRSKFLRGVNHQRFYSELRANLQASESVLYVIEPDMLYGIPDARSILVYGFHDWTNLPETPLRNRQVAGDPSQRIALLMPVDFASNGKLAQTQSSFPRVTEWKHIRLKAAPEWGLWVSSESVLGAR
jgi:hypothetical protein